MTSNPYRGLASRAFWRSAVSEIHPLAPADFYEKKFEISKADKIATAGSCFAQHIARAMKHEGFAVMDVEPAPPTLPHEVRKRFGFDIYSARYANIYTAAQLKQILLEAFEGATSPDPVWEHDGRYYDSMRPSVEPNGLPCKQEVHDHRKQHLASIRRLLSEMDVFIFTLGLTECWKYKGSDWVFPTAPGTIAGSYNPDHYEFINFSHSQILDDLLHAIYLIKKHNKSKELRFLFTVSPVPLTATYSGENVIVASSYSKAVLRSVAGEVVSTVKNSAYFPSYEMVTSPISRGIFFDGNMRTVNKAGVDIIMRSFLSKHKVGSGVEAKSTDMQLQSSHLSDDDVACEEALLSAFSPT